jgi:uncharacterized membrane protein YkvA (DUF1232 family)
MEKEQYEETSLILPSLLILGLLGFCCTLIAFLFLWKKIKSPKSHTVHSGDFWDGMKMVLDIFRNRYRPNWTFFCVFFLTLLYLFSPLDLIPDVIPVVGWLDDGAISLFFLKYFQEEVEKYRQQKIQK